jgi:ribonucleoside-diphosphate reductase alpha chain
VGGHEGYITVGLFEDGQPGELFITMAKEGSTIGGLMDTIGTETSLGLQYGVPLRVFVDKFSHTRFEPSGWTNNKEIPHAKSVVDYIFRWLGIQFIAGYREANTPQRPAETATTAETKTGATANGASAAPAAKPTVHTNGNGKGKHHDVEPELELGGPAIRSQQFANFQTDAPACDNCGAITVRNGNCYLCHNCGNSMGCS